MKKRITRDKKKENAIANVTSFLLTAIFSIDIQSNETQNRFALKITKKNGKKKNKKIACVKWKDCDF